MLSDNCTFPQPPASPRFKSKRLRRHIIAIGILLSLVVIATRRGQEFITKTATTVGRLSSPSSDNDDVAMESRRTMQQQRQQSDDCEALLLHERGYWEHSYASPSSSLHQHLQFQQQYFPQEIDWVNNKNLPATWDECTPQTIAIPKNASLMYASQLGNQCGSCGITGFRPSVSIWRSAVKNEDDSNGASALRSNHGKHDSNNDDLKHNTNKKLAAAITTKGEVKSPTLSLIQQLSNTTLCFAGDSIDYQLYDALRHNLVRQQFLQNQVKISIQQNEWGVNFTEWGMPRYDNKDRWHFMQNVKETVVDLEYNNTHGNKSSKEKRKSSTTTTIRYFKTYGWAPWNTLYFTSCSILILNLGLHYKAREAEIRGLYYGEPPFLDDFRGALTYLVEFERERSGRLAIWRSTLPQHWDTFDGHHEKNKTCSMKKLLKQRQTNDDSSLEEEDDEVIQNYNKAAEKGFDIICPRHRHLSTNKTAQSTSSSCRSKYERICTVNQTSIDYRTVYRTLLENNCTEGLKRYYQGKKAQSTTSLTGRILRWNIADLFDVPEWHFRDDDCSHFCYVPSLYEAAFERMGLLISQFS